MKTEENGDRGKRDPPTNMGKWPIRRLKSFMIIPREKVQNKSSSHIAEKQGSRIRPKTREGEMPL